MRADYHPLRLRRILPSAGHLLELEAAAAARDRGGAEPGARERLGREVACLLSAHSATRTWGQGLVRCEFLDLSKAIQWARAGRRILVVPIREVQGATRPEAMRVGRILLPAPFIYLAFADPLPTPDPELSLEGKYLGEGGATELLLAGFADHIAATIVVVRRKGDRGSAAFLLRCEIPLGDPEPPLAAAVSISAAEGFGAFASNPTIVADRVRWTAALAKALETALHAASQAAAAPLPRGRRDPAEVGGLAEETAESQTIVPVPVAEFVAIPSAEGGCIADVLFGTTPPRLRHRCPSLQPRRRPHRCDRRMQRVGEGTSDAVRPGTAAVRSCGPTTRARSGNSRAPPKRTTSTEDPPAPHGRSGSIISTSAPLTRLGGCEGMGWTPP